MANKKRKRQTQSRAGRSGASRPSSVATESVKVRPAEPGGPNRQARKDEARRQREAIRRRQARRRYMRVGVIIVSVLVAIALAVGLPIVLGRNTTKKLQQAERAAGCSAVRTIQPFAGGEDRAHIGAQGAGGTVQKAPALSSYRSIPPASGPHDPTPLHTGVYNNPPNVYRTIHSLEHGAVVIWYSKDAPAAQVTALGTAYHFMDHVIVANYDYPKAGTAGQLPAGKQMVLVAWHHMMTCNAVSVDATKLFVKYYRTPTSTTGTAPAGYKGDAPEIGLAI